MRDIQVTSLSKKRNGMICYLGRLTSQYSCLYLLHVDMITLGRSRLSQIYY